MKKLVIEFLKCVLKGIILGNCIANIAYVILYLVDCNEGRNIILQLFENNNYIKMLVYTSLSGIFSYVPFIIYEIFIKNKLEEFSKKVEKNYFFPSIVVIIYMLLFYMLQLISIQKEFKMLYGSLILTIICSELSIIMLINIPTVVHQEINWLNENLKQRNKFE